jgi:hypothetical protein
MRLAGKWLPANDSQINFSFAATNGELRQQVNWHMVYQTKGGACASFPRQVDHRIQETAEKETRQWTILPR